MGDLGSGEQNMLIIWQFLSADWPHSVLCVCVCETPYVLYTWDCACVCLRARVCARSKHGQFTKSS